MTLPQLQCQAARQQLLELRAQLYLHMPRGEVKGREGAETSIHLLAAVPLRSSDQVLCTQGIAGSTHTAGMKAIPMWLTLAALGGAVAQSQPNQQPNDTDIFNAALQLVRMLLGATRATGYAAICR